MYRFNLCWLQFNKYLILFYLSHISMQCQFSLLSFYDYVHDIVQLSYTGCLLYTSDAADE